MSLMSDAGLRGVESVGNLGQVEILANGLPNDAELLKIHVALFPVLAVRGPLTDTMSSYRHGKKHGTVNEWLPNDNT